MPHPEYLCSHTNEVIDDIRGDIICTDCGLVLCDKLLKSYSPKQYQNDMSKSEKIEESEVNEMLEKLNLPNCFTQVILKNYNQKKVEKKRKERKKLLSYAIYDTLSTEGSPITIKEISGVSGFKDSEIYRMQNDVVIMLEPSLLLEKYCKILNLDYKTYSVIKTGLPASSLTGHNPLTIIASTIYEYLKKYTKNYISMKEIAKTVNTSCISITRYLKENELSFRL